MKGQDMKRRIFTEEERLELEKNPNILKVLNSNVEFCEEFKSRVVREHDEEGKSAKQIFADINCEAAQYGEGGNDIAKLVSWGKEARDVWTGQNTNDSSASDNYANKIGRLLGTKYPNDDCQVIVKKYIDK